ncbi:VTT domain-containing protein [Tsuneonella sp. YG55]|uniref:VTT domain-containing protein n=1 Tax=Tsuneonella litorea TaxID=2976475 RepID=A0A9X2W163_9SPHN|nr:VTT domain-containing protein [Tsuneonella litorea]MCT2558906.1 VTT domain-containing protein [Tsuneonella litorea]
MGSAIVDWLPLDSIQAMLAAPFGEVWVALGFFALAASVYASGVPGTLLPISFSSGALLGGALGILAVGLGAVIGSLVLYGVLERGSRTALRTRYGHHLAKLDGWAQRGGILPLVALRLAGLPHLAVTAACALAAVGARRYVLATAVGVLPAVALSSIAGAML